MKCINEKGNANRNCALLVGIFGFLCVFTPLYFELSYWIVIGGWTLGMLLMGVSGLVTQSATLDLRAFSRDPFGWRKAKQSYQATTDGASGDEAHKDSRQ